MQSQDYGAVARVELYKHTNSMESGMERLIQSRGHVIRFVVYHHTLLHPSQMSK